MSGYETKVFVYHKEPTAGDIARLVWENDYNDWKLNVERLVNEPLSSNSLYLQTSPYRWEVTFRKDFA